MAETLTPKTIFETIMQDKKVQIRLEPEEAYRLSRYLAVLKSREKNIYKDLGFDYEAMHIKYNVVEKKYVAGIDGKIMYEFYAEKPRPLATYECVVIDNVSSNGNK